MGIFLEVKQVIQVSQPLFALFALVFVIHTYPILDTRISVRSDFVRRHGCAMLPPLDSETGWTGELWSNRVLLILENLENSNFFRQKKIFSKFSDF